MVADGSLDLYTVAQRSSLSSWDYLAGVLIAREAGASVYEYEGQNLIFSGREPRYPLVAASEELALAFLAHGRL